MKRLLFVYLLIHVQIMGLAQNYRISYSKEFDRVLSFVSQNEVCIDSLCQYLTKEDALLAMCIVAPEISQYSYAIDIMETNILKILYVQGRASNFSIGPFQMKPSFVEKLEAIVRQDSLYNQFSHILINEDGDRKCRNERVLRLSSLSWQKEYLALFVSIVKNITSSIKFNDNDEKLRYWATLYNAGFHLQQKAIRNKMQLDEFPRLLNTNNYSNICLEFYHYSEFCRYFR